MFSMVGKLVMQQKKNKFIFENLGSFSHWLINFLHFWSILCISKKHIWIIGYMRGVFVYISCQNGYVFFCGANIPRSCFFVKWIAFIFFLGWLCIHYNPILWRTISIGRRKRYNAFGSYINQFVPFDYFNRWEKYRIYTNPVFTYFRPLHHV